VGKRAKVRWCVFLLLWIAFTSCHVLYVPNSFNSPLLRNRGDGQVNLAAGAAGYEVQVAYAITDKIGVMANGQSLESTKKDTITEHRTLCELGFGYTEKYSDNGIFEIYGGGGIGNVPADFKDSYYDGTQTTQIKRFFVQPGIGFFNDWLDLSVVSRFSAANIGNETNLFFEPGVSFKMGYKRIRFCSSVGLSFPFKPSRDRNWDYNPVIFSVGIHLNFGKRLDD